MPYKYNDLKEKIEIICPIKGINETGIYDQKINKCIAPIILKGTTFVYARVEDNLICNKKEDMDFLEEITQKKTESRMANFNSEDAVTWNVFRSIEKEKEIDNLLTSILGFKISNSKLIYWSYGDDNITRARDILKENKNRGTEPDLIIKCDQCLISIEAKYTSGNKTHKNETEILKKYESYCNYKQLFKLGMSSICKTHTYEKYELARNWLLGDAMRGNKPFYLLNLTLESREQDIENIMEKIIIQDDNHKFKRITWEQIYQFCKQNECCKELRDYMENAAYYENSILKKAFNTK